MKKLVTIATVAVILLVTSTVVFAATGGLERLFLRSNSNFEEFAKVAPLYPAYAIDHGIRIEVTGAMQVGNVVFVSTMTQDITGENRLTWLMQPDIEFYFNGESMSSEVGVSRQSRFDTYNNIIYTKWQLMGRDDMPKADTIELVINNIFCTKRSGEIDEVRRESAFDGEWDITVNVRDLGIQPIVWDENVNVGNLYIEHMSLTPYGLQITGTHNYDPFVLQDEDIRGYGVHNRINVPNIEVAVEFEGRLRNTRVFESSSGSFSDNDFDFFNIADIPIDLDLVTAIIINGERIQIP